MVAALLRGTRGESAITKSDGRESHPGPGADALHSESNIPLDERAPSDSKPRRKKDPIHVATIIAFST